MSGFNFDNTYLSLPGKFYTPVKPEQFKKPEFSVVNRDFFSALDIDFGSEDEMLSILSGQSLHKNSNPFAQAYAGHQFGSFTMLGDGRAVFLGEHLTNQNIRFDIQLKGAGRTPYSRGGDGKAVLKAMLREHLIGEAMHHLNIPTSRSLAVIKTGEDVYRETINDGALLARVMKSHIRIGTFEFASYFGSKEDLEALLHYTIERIYPAIKGDKNPALRFLKEVMRVQIDLVVNWMRVGFIHGVMNTDNVSVSGESFDYGPCAFMNSYHPQTFFSSIDVNGRYSFANQPKVLKWNLIKLAQALLPLIDTTIENAIPLAQQTLDSFDTIWTDSFYTVMLDKLGVENKTVNDRHLADEVLHLMEQLKLDYTNTFAALSSEIEPLTAPLTENPLMKKWLLRWKKRVAQNSYGFETAKKIMKNHNPIFIARNHTVEKALDEACDGDYRTFNQLEKILKSPYSYHSGCSNSLNPPSQEFQNSYQTFCGT